LLLRVSRSPKQIVFIVITTLLALGAVFCFSVVQRAKKAIADGAQSAAASNYAGVSVIPLRNVTSSFEPVLAAGEFRSAAEFEGNLYVCSSSALFRYSQGTLKKTWIVGRDLPQVQLLSLAVRLGIGNPELWIATSEGIVIFDGTAFRQLQPEDAALRKVSALLPLPNGNVLVGTKAHGLYVSDGKSFRRFHEQFGNLQVTVLAGDENALWIGTRSDGAWFWRGGEAQHILADLPDRQVLSAEADGDEAWIGTPLGITEFRTGKLNRRLADGIFAQALMKESGKLWVGTIDQGTFSIPLGGERPRPQLISGIDGGEPVAAFIKFGKTGAAIEARRIRQLPDFTPIFQTHSDLLTSGHITAIHEDSRGHLWVGYFDRGIDRVVGVENGGATHFEDDTLFCINRLKEDPRDGSLFVATANGLAVFDTGGKLRQVLKRENGLISSNVNDILFRPTESGKSGLAIATPSGVSFLENGAVSSIYAFQGLVNNHAFTLADWNDGLAVGTLGGLSIVRRGLVQASFNTANSGLRQNWITASTIFDHSLYAGTYGSGIVRLDTDGTVQSFPAFAGRRVEINLNALAATDRALYAGTAGQGLAVLRAGQDRWQFITAGLPSLSVTALDARGGRLYVGTDNGLVRISESNLLP
jgi:ligand-binding sensor domain-containing protein